MTRYTLKGAVYRNLFRRQRSRSRCYIAIGVSTYGGLTNRNHQDFTDRVIQSGDLHYSGISKCDGKLNGKNVKIDHAKQMSTWWREDFLKKFPTIDRSKDE